MGTVSNSCVTADIGVSQMWKNEVYCTGMLTCESTFKLTGGEITITQCTLVVHMMKCGSLSGTADTVLKMIDRLIKYFVPHIISCLLFAVTFLSLISLNGSKWSSLLTWTSAHCFLKLKEECLQVDALLHGEYSRWKETLKTVSQVSIGKAVTQWLCRYTQSHL